jgi:hypothetical protein
MECRITTSGSNTRRISLASQCNISKTPIPLIPVTYVPLYKSTAYG